MATTGGIVGTGKISHDLLTAMKSLPDGEHHIVGVAAREKESAVDFSKKNNVQKAFESYEELAKDDEVEVIIKNSLE